MNGALKGGGIAAAVTLGALVLAPVAEATDRFVEPGGTTMGMCTDPTPGLRCDFQYAIETAAAMNDNVFVAAGVYPETDEVFVDELGVDVIGAGSPQSSLSSTATNALQIVASDTSVSGLQITHSTGTGSALLFGVNGSNSVVERVSASTSSGSAACRAIATGAVTLRDSVCRNTFSGGDAAVLVDPDLSPTVTLRNVTGYATGTSARGLYATVQMGDDVVVNARNSIFLATSPEVDVYAISGTAGDTITVDLDFSNYADSSEDDANADTSVTMPGSLGNITAVPLFVSADGNFNQAAGSPTIDKGSAAVSSLGALDLDGQARVQGPAPDIGADEFVPPAMPTSPQPAAMPAVTTPQRKCKKRKKRAAASKRKRCKRRKK